MFPGHNAAPIRSGQQEPEGDKKNCGGKGETVDNTANTKWSFWKKRYFSGEEGVAEFIEEEW